MWCIFIFMCSVGNAEMGKGEIEAANLHWFQISFCALANRREISAFIRLCIGCGRMSRNLISWHGKTCKETRGNGIADIILKGDDGRIFQAAKHALGFSPFFTMLRRGPGKSGRKEFTVPPPRLLLANDLLVRWKIRKLKLQTFTLSFISEFRFEYVS